MGRTTHKEGKEKQTTGERGTGSGQNKKSPSRWNNSAKASFKASLLVMFVGILLRVSRTSAMESRADVRTAVAAFTAKVAGMLRREKWLAARCTSSMRLTRA